MVAVKKDKTSGDCLGTGRRKKAIARVRLRPGSGKITINGAADTTTITRCTAVIERAN